MPDSFHRSTKSLNQDGTAFALVVLASSLLILSAWGCWALRSRVTRYEITGSARLEIDRAVYPVEAHSAGRLVVTRLALGQEVRVGDVLVELDSENERLKLREELTRFNAFAPQIAALRLQSGLQDQGRDKERRVLAISIEEARERSREADALAQQAERDAARSAQLFKEKLISLADDERARADAQSKRASVESLRTAAARLEPELEVRESDRAGRLKQILADIAKLEAQAATSETTIRSLEYELERRSLRAPVAGRLGDCADVRPGSYISQGERLGVILPPGDLRMVADFAPPAALGRIRAGQPAVIRFEGFPWAQYGTTAAKVTRVAGEVRDGKVRVELAVSLDRHSPIPFQHGMPGSVEIEIERVSPATLLMRAAGGLAAGRQ
jgi:membrane fusion protein (multidrug efflux system)